MSMEHNPGTMNEKIDDKKLSNARTSKQCNDKEMKTSNQKSMESFQNGFFTWEENDGKGDCMPLVFMEINPDMMDNKIDEAKLSNALHRLVDFELRCYFTDEDVTDLLRMYDGNVEVVKQKMRDIVSDMIGWARAEREQEKDIIGFVDKNRVIHTRKILDPSIVSSRGLKYS